MRIISFAWTSPSLVFGQKTCTRRPWEGRYARTFHAGDEAMAYDRSPRIRGNWIATIQLTADPEFLPMADMPDSDYEAEGFAWSLAHPAAMTRTIEGLPRDHFMQEVCTKEGFERWRQSEQSMWVIRFRLLSLTNEGTQLKTVLTEQLEAAGQLEPLPL